MDLKNSFPAKLHNLLSNTNNHYAIGWMNGGLCFKVFNQDELVSTILPQYFKSKL